MQTLFYKYPEKIGEELKAQYNYRKAIDKPKIKELKRKGNLNEDKGYIVNYETLSIAIRKVQKDDFNNLKTRINQDGFIDEEASRPATISKLMKVTSNQKISYYFILFSAFKALNIMSENNILKMLDYYKIKPKKDVDKSVLQHIRSNQEEISTSYECFSLIMEKILENELCCISIDEKIKVLYKFGLPTYVVNQKNPLTDNNFTFFSENKDSIIEEYSNIEKMRDIVKIMDEQEIEKLKSKEIERCKNNVIKERLRQVLDQRYKYNLAEHLIHIINGFISRDII